MENLRHKISRNNVISILLVAIIITVSFFLWSYLRKTSPLEALKEIMPIQPVNTPNFLFAIGGNEDILSEPYDVATAANGNIYIADTGNKDIKVFDPNGKFLYKFGTRGKERGQFLAPTGITITKNKVYVTDGLTMKVQIFDLTGQYLGDLITANIKNAYGAIRPMGISTDENNNIFLSDIFNHRILKFNDSGQVVLAFGKPGDEKGYLYYPNDVTVDNEGYIYVSDSNNARVQVFDPAGKFFKVYGDKSKDLEIGLAITRGVTVDNKGYLYIADAAQSKIFVIRADKNKPEPLFNIEGSGADYPLKMPTGITSHGNRVIVADTGNHRILVYRY